MLFHFLTKDFFRPYPILLSLESSQLQVHFQYILKTQLFQSASPEKQSQWDVCACIYMHTQIDELIKEIYFEELAHMIMEAGKGKICKIGWQARDPGKNCNLNLKIL